MGDLKGQVGGPITATGKVCPTRLWLWEKGWSHPSLKQQEGKKGNKCSEPILSSWSPVGTFHWLNTIRSQRAREANKTVYKNLVPGAQGQVAKDVVWIWRGTWKVSSAELNRVSRHPCPFYFTWSWPELGSLKLKDFFLIGITRYFSSECKNTLRIDPFFMPFSSSTSKNNNNVSTPFSTMDRMRAYCGG